MNVLVCNAGSSTLKFALIEAESELLLVDGIIDWSVHPARVRMKAPKQEEVRAELPVGDHADAIRRILGDLANVQGGRSGIYAVGHRVVHGGDRYLAAARITPEVKRTIAALAELAPLHNPPSLQCIEAFEKMLPGHRRHRPGAGPARGRRSRQGEVAQHADRVPTLRV